MKILVIDVDEAGLSFCWRCAMAGHSVKWFVQSSKHNNLSTGQGFKGVERIDNWVAQMKWADLIFSTSHLNQYMDRIEFFMKKGFPIYAPSKAGLNLEISRKAGMELMEKVGIEVAPYKTFKTMDDAAKYIKKTEARYVFKTLGDNEDKSLTYVSKSPADLLEWIQRVRDRKEEPKGEVMLQTFIKGTEIGVSKWMGRDGFVGQYNESFEHKKLAAGNYGPNVGEMGTVAAFVSKSKIGDETLGKLEKELVKLGHMSDAALGFMVDDAGKPWPTEWAARPGWPIFNLMLGSISGDPASWMKDALSGKDTTTFKEDIGVCVRIYHGDGPRSTLAPDEVSNVPVYGITKGNKKHLHPVSVKIDPHYDMESEKVVERPVWNTTGTQALVVTGYGDTVKQAVERAYKTASQLSLSNILIRNDIGAELETQLPELHKHGYATHFKYDKEPK